MFVSSLRALWSDAVYAKGLLVQYCLSKGGTDYYEAWMRQSNVIDEVRAVFRNIGETRHMVGSRPFEPLLDMLNEFEKLDPSPWQLPYTRPRYFGRSQKNITDSWKAFQDVFLEEFDRPEPFPFIWTRGVKRQQDDIKAQQGLG